MSVLKKKKLDLYTGNTECWKAKICKFVSLFLLLFLKMHSENIALDRSTNLYFFSRARINVDEMYLFVDQVIGAMNKSMK